MKKESVAIRPLTKFGDSYGLNRFSINEISETAEFYERQAIKRRMMLCLGVEVDTRNCRQK